MRTTTRTIGMVIAIAIPIVRVVFRMGPPA